MDNHIFRSALGGFNRQDVTEYIERTRKEAEEAAAQLEAQVKSLQDSEAEARQSLDSCTQEKEDLEKQLEEMTLQYTQTKNDWDAVTEAKETLEAEETVGKANAQAEEIVTKANARAEAIVAEAQAQAEVLLRETEEQVEGTVNQFGTLFTSFETITGHLTNELRKMDVTVSQLPISFNHLRDSLQALLERAKKR